MLKTHNVYVNRGWSTCHKGVPTVYTALVLQIVQENGSGP